MQSTSEHKNPGRPRNESLVTFDTIQFLRVSFQVKLVFGKFWTILLILGVANHRRHFLSAKQLILGAHNAVLLQQKAQEKEAHNCIRIIISHTNNKPNIYIYIYIYIYTHMSICICICICIYVFACIYNIMYIINIHTHTHIYIYYIYPQTRMNIFISHIGARYSQYLKIKELL